MTSLLCPNATDSYVEFSPSTLFVDNFAVSPDGKTLLVASPVGLYLYDALTLTYQGTLKCGSDQYVGAWSPDSSELAIFYSTCVGIQIWDGSVQKLEKTFTFPQDNPYCSNPSPSEPYGPTPTVDGLVWSPDGRYLAAIGGEPFRIWDLETGTAIFEDNLTDSACPSGGCDSAERIAWSPNSSQLVYIHDCEIDQWIVNSTAFQHLFDLTCQNSQSRYDFVTWSQNNLLAFGGDWGSSPLQVWNMNSRKQILSSDQNALHLSWSPDGSLLAAATSIGDRADEITLFNTQGQIVKTFAVPIAVQQIAWNPDGQHLYVRSSDNVLSSQLGLYNIQTGERVATLISCATHKAENPAFDCSDPPQ